MPTQISIEESKKQKNIIRELNSNIKGKNLKYFIKNYGCQMNAHDSEKLIGILQEIGYIETEIETEAAFVIYNTCCVRENAENKVYGRLGHLKTYKEKHPHVKIALCGCMMQQETVIEVIRKKYKHVDLVFGTHNLYKLPELLKANIEAGHTIIDIWEDHKEIVEDIPSIRKFKFKACVNIVYGCNNFCTYCIVPYVRGRERSRMSGDILNEITKLANDGVKEIMLLGQNVNSYGKENEDTFAQLLRRVCDIEGIERIRFMTSHPKDLSDDLIKTIKECDKVCNHLHLPVQSGSSKLLKKMNRKYTKEQYLELVEKIRKEIPDITLTTDIIVGFPGETDEDNDETIDLVKNVGFDSAYTYLYSKRTGTPAATMEDQVEESVAKERFNKLLGALDIIVKERSEEKKGLVLKVLVEEINKNGMDMVTGRTESNNIVHLKGSEELIGNIVTVKITSAKTFYLIGEIV